MMAHACQPANTECWHSNPGVLVLEACYLLSPMSSVSNEILPIQFMAADPVGGGWLALQK